MLLVIFYAFLLNSQISKKGLSGYAILFLIIIAVSLFVFFEINVNKSFFKSSFILIAKDNKDAKLNGYYLDHKLTDNLFSWQITSLIRTSPESFNGSLLMMYF